MFNFFTDALIIPSTKASKTSRGLLLYKGYTYSWRNKKAKGAYWTCSSHQKKGCKANVTTIELNEREPIVCRLNLEHNHPPRKLKLPSDIEYI